MDNLPVIYRPVGSNPLPDNAQWTNRMEIRSESSNRLYTVAQNKTGRFWACSCQGFLRWKHCKHLDAMRLPGYHKAYEVQVTNR